MLSDAQYTAVGRVTITAAELEAAVCMLLVLATGNDRDPDEMLIQRNSKWREELKELAQSGQMPDGPTVMNWVDRCDAAFSERNEIVHSRWGMTPGEHPAGYPLGMHTSRDRQTRQVKSKLVPADEDYWNELADTLEDLRHEAGPFIGAAAVRHGLL